MKRAIIVHGWQSQPLDGWKPWLNNELSARGFQVRTPSMPNAMHPKVERWVEELHDVIGTPDAACHLIGHSLGCPAILRYLETLPKGHTVGTVVLVAGFVEDLGIADIAGFVSQPFDYKHIRAAAKKIVSIYSQNDEYISLEKFERMHTALGAKAILVQDGKHFSGVNGCYQLPQMLDALQ